MHAAQVGLAGSGFSEVQLQPHLRREMRQNLMPMNIKATETHTSTITN